VIGRGAFVGVLTLALLTAPLAAKAQPTGPVRTVGILGHTAAVPFEAGLRDLGWVQGKNIRFERRVSTDDETLARFAAELSRVPVDVIFAGNAPSTRAAMQATRVIPIITVSADPVSTGFVASLAHPGGNVTGVAIMHTELSGKRLEILTQALPAARRIAFLVNPANPSTPAVRRETEARARALGVKLLPFEVSAPERVAKVMAAVAKEHPDALVVQGDPLFQVTRQDLLEAAARHRLPAMWEWRAWVEAGGLMSYGANPGELYRRAAIYADRVLRGMKPSDLPVEQATKFELVINLKTAKAVGLTFPPSLLARADEVIQ
jgi:putative ABC transport system substrate-binding protein